MLELVVVLAILAVMTSVSLSFMGEKDEKQRYQASLTKLKAVKRGFLSVAQYQGQTVVSGFLVDNGVLYFPDPDPLGLSGVPNLGESINALLGYQHLPTLKSFSSVPVYVNTHADNDNDDDINKVEVNGSQLFKGVRPGLFDLSEYRDSGGNSVANVRGAIKDGWGDEFEESPTVSPPATLVNVNVKNEVGKEYKDLPIAARIIGFSIAEFSLKISTLLIEVKNLPDTTTKFKVALVSFNNEEGCEEDTGTAAVDHIACWHTVKTDLKVGSLEPFDNTFLLTQAADPAAIYDDSSLTIEGIAQELTPTSPEKLSALSFSDNEDDSWGFSEILRFNNTFSFSGEEEITAGSHLLVLLCYNTVDVQWEVYSPTAGCAQAPQVASAVGPSVDPVFEYLHLLPGVLPDPIILEIKL
jgi:type II secretory pathway pseudopilin PulG